MDMIIKHDFSNPCTTLRKKHPYWIVVHYTGCEGSAEAVCRSMARKGKASTNYIVDDREVWHAVDECTGYAWHTATTGLETYCDARNFNSIAVDLCCYRDGGVLRISEDTLRMGAIVCAHLCAWHGIAPAHVVRHYDVTRKLCPAPLVDEAAWAAFKAQIEENLKIFGRR